MDGAGMEEERVPKGPECKEEKEDTLLNAEHFVVHADAVSGNSAWSSSSSSVLSAFQSTAANEEAVNISVTGDRISPLKKVEEDERYCTLQATGSASQDSAALHGLALVCGQLSDFHSDGKAVPPLSVVGFVQEPTGCSGLHELCESCFSGGIEKEAKEKRSNTRSRTRSDGIPGDLCRQDVCGPATCQLSQCTSASAAAQQSYKESSVLQAGRSHHGTKGKKGLFEHPGIPPPVRKKSRTFYSAEQLEELEKMFQEDHYPDNEKRREIAAVIGVTPQRVMVWFQNRRAKWRKSEKLSKKDHKKRSTSLAPAVPIGAEGYGAPLLPVPPLPDVAHDQSSTLSTDATAGSYSSTLSGHPAPPATSSSVSSAAGPVPSCEADQTEALPQLNFSSSRPEGFPSLPSPPPIRRASLPLSLSFNPSTHIVPLVLDTPNGECSLSTQENGSSMSSPVSCNFTEQMESTAHLETTYCQYSSQGGIYQLPQYPQHHQLSQFHHMPGHLASNVLSSVCLTPTTPPESHTAFLALPGNGGVISYGAGGATQGYVQNHMGEQLLLQQPSGNSGIAAFQAVPWNDFYTQGAPFPNQLHSQMPLPSAAGGQYLIEQTAFAQPPCRSPSPYLQGPSEMALGALPHDGKRKGVTPPDQSSYPSHQEPELTALPEREEAEGSKKGQTIIDIEEDDSD